MSLARIVCGGGLHDEIAWDDVSLTLSIRPRQDAHARNLIDADSLSMIEGVFQVSELCARDIMIPRAQMDAINIAESPDEFIPFVLEKAHSRYPVYDGNRDNVHSMPRMTEVVPVMRRAFAWARENAMEVRSLHVPRCLLGDDAIHALDPGQGDRVWVVTPDAELVVDPAG